ncbi:MAG: sugar ABC transporter permease [Chloroflexi bacterium]|nr:sugar ABC transporter permease [Chloroflexota bacterium]MXX50952.1 sugar ABC transporter permease [Chloroflexota bacterium]MXX83669.1 sugar ABC transporter permease [Chloroflexota bacterium]MYA94685.1 sugar ABC transporter permease [Chloroflexota bacterium]MYC56172.1 sugar ABC transporter permease [Chloroflexota bacterium]
MLPLLSIHVFVVAIPAVQGIYMSLTDWSGVGRNVEFIGLANYQELLFEDETFGKSLTNNFIWMAFFLTVPFILALFCATLLSQIKRGGMAYRSMLFIPYVLASVVTTAIWRNLLSPRKGIGAAMANLTGIEGFDIAYLGRSETALLSIAFIDNWHFWGFLMILFLAAMQAIPPVLYDAAKIDGANRWQEFRHVTLPGIRPIFLFMFMMVAIWSFLAFDYIWLLTQGGPGGSSEVIATQLYKNAFLRFEGGYGAAQGVVISIFAGFIIMIFVTLRRRGWDI